MLTCSEESVEELHIESLKLSKKGKRRVSLERAQKLYNKKFNHAVR